MGDPSDNRRYYAAIPGVGVFRSDNGGTMWTDINGNLPGSIMANSSLILLSVSPCIGCGTQWSPIYALVADMDAVVGVYRLGGDDEPWLGLTPLPDLNKKFPSANIHSSILADRDRPNVVFVGGSEGPLFRWNGNSWETMPSGQHYDSLGMAFEADVDLLECDAAGIY